MTEDTISKHHKMLEKNFRGASQMDVTVVTTDAFWHIAAQLQKIPHINSDLLGIMLGNALRNGHSRFMFEYGPCLDTNFMVHTAAISILRMDNEVLLDVV